MKCVPRQSGKHQSVTCDAVKDHVINQIQKTCENGDDIATTVRENNYTIAGLKKPKRKTIYADAFFTTK